MKKETKERLKNNKEIQCEKPHFASGVSMITLIITIIVIIILAAIAFVGIESTTGNATHAKFGHELSEIEEKVKAKQTANAELGVGEDIKHTGFTKVVVEGAPDDFVSFDTDSITGYWVNMKTINEDTIKTGHEELTEMRVKFNYQDVYIYDAEGKVYYAKGWYDGDEVLHYRLTADESSTKVKPEIGLVTYTLSGDKKSATITVIANAKSGGTLEVIIGGKTATKTGDNTYTVTVTENGAKSILVKESGAGNASSSISISGIEIEEEKDITPPEITSLTSKVTGKTVLIEGSAKEIESNIIGYKFTTSANEPTDWTSVNSMTIQASHNATVSGPYYLWVKNSEGLVNSSSINVIVPQVYTIKYNPNGGSLGNVVNSQEKIENQNITLDNNSPTKIGHTFKGWGTSSNATTALYQPGNTYAENASIELFAIWESHKYTITYNANGGSLDKVAASQVKTYGQDIKLDPNSPVREGYVFQGWGTLANSTVATCMPGVMYTANADLNLFAVWKAKTYTITYNANGGTGAPASESKTHGESKKLSTTTPKREGYTFQGWATSSSSSVVAYDPGDTYTGNANVELHAVWKANTYTITYNANGGSGAPGSETKTHGEGKKLSTTTPKREGYTFQGWATSSSSSAVAYNAGDTYTGNTNLELHAVWKANTYTITYNANGGSLDKVPSTQTKTYGTAATLNSNSPVRDGYIFKGWGTTDTATTATYQPGGTYSTDADLKIFAIWEKEIAYGLSGKWIWNDELNITKSLEWQKINLISNSTSYYGIGIDYDSTTLPSGRVTEYKNIAYGKINSETRPTSAYDVQIAYDYTNHMSDEEGTYWDDNNVYKTIDFGTTPQKVSEEFYNWFMANATEYTEPESEYQLSGKWKFNDLLVYDGNEDLIETIAFTSNDYNYTGMTISKGSINVVYNSDYWDEIILYIFDEWDTDYQIVDFGTTPQKVSEEFYNWFMANATEYDETESEYQLSGKWKFNEELNIETDLELTQEIEYKVNNINYSSMYVWKYTRADSGVVYIDGKGSKYYPYDLEFTIEGDSYWEEQVYRLIDFGSEPQPVSQEFYEWFTANATEYTETESEYQLSGNWKLNETLVFPSKEITQSINFRNDIGIANEMSVYTDAFTYTIISNEQGEPGEGIIYIGFWGSEADRYIIFGSEPQPVSQEFYEWFIANATEYVETITFTIEEVEYIAEKGMTWGEWVASDYNTGGYTVNMGGIYTGNADIYVHNTATKFDVTSSKSEITNGYDYILRVRSVWS